MECSTSGDDQSQSIFSGGDPSRSSPGMSRSPFLRLRCFPLSTSSFSPSSMAVDKLTQRLALSWQSASLPLHQFFLFLIKCLSSNIYIYIYIYKSFDPSTNNFDQLSILDSQPVVSPSSISIF